MAARAAAAPARGRKYGNKKVEIDGHQFDSKAEGLRYMVLRERQRAGEINNLRLHPKYPLEINGVLVCRYEGDFLYQVTLTERWVLEDVKGVKTAVYRLKKKLLRAVHGIDITEVTVR